MNRQKFFAMIMAVLVVLGGAIWGVVLTTGAPTEAKNKVVVEGVFVPGPRSSERLEQLSVEMEKTAKYEMSYGCTKPHELTGQPMLCGKSVEKLKKLESEYNKEYIRINKRSDQDIEKVKKHAREVAENPSLELEFSGSFNSPYTDKNPKRVEYYKDSKNNQYTVDPINNKVIDFTDESAVEDHVKNINKAALREKAEKYLTKHVLDFVEVKKSYVYEEGGKGDPKGDAMYAFRWNAPSKMNNEDMLPFVMVRLSPSGKIIGFTDTRSLYQ